MNLFLPKTFKPAKWKRTRPAEDPYACQFIGCDIGPQDHSYVMSDQGIWHLLQQCKQVTEPLPIDLHDMLQRCFQIVRQRRDEPPVIYIVPDAYHKQMARLLHYHKRHCARKLRWIRAGRPTYRKIKVTINCG